MDFEFSDDETALGEGMRRLCAGRFGLDRLRALEGSSDVVGRDGWRVLAEAGVFSLRVQGDEGLGLGLAEAAVVFEELGRALVPGPLAASHLAATLGIVPEAGTGDIVVGSVTRPRHSGSDAIAPVLVENLGALDQLVIVDDLCLSIVEPESLEAVVVERSIDPLTPLWRLDRLPEGRKAGDGELASRWRREEEILDAAFLVGLASVMLELAVDYAKGREQFGRAIGSFQAVKHLCADMLVRAEVARAATHAAAVTADQPDVGDLDRAGAGAALLAAEAATANGRSCIQVHGGMGFTWEVPAHLYVMRAKVVAARMRSAGELAALVAERY